MTESTAYLTPAELHITPAEHAYLIRAAAILDQMDPGQYHRIPNDGLWLFDMANVAMATECGTAGCILGLCERLVEIDNLDTEVKPFEYGSISNEIETRAYSLALGPLFYPDLVSMRAVTPQDAARATRRFLTTGVAHFEGHEYYPRPD